MAIDVFVAGASPVVVLEGSPLDKFTLLTSSPILRYEGVTVDFEIVPGTATPKEDYSYESTTATFDPVTGIYTDSVTIPSGGSISSFGISLLQDTFVEGPEFFNVNIIAASGGARVNQNPSVTVTVLDDEIDESNDERIVTPTKEVGDLSNRVATFSPLEFPTSEFPAPELSASEFPVPELSISESWDSNQVTISAELNAAEPGADGQFLVSLAEAAETETFVAYSVTGTATANADYAALTGLTAIPAGSLSAPIAVTVLDDEYLEESETVVVSLDAVTAGDDDVMLSTIHTATVTIADSAPSILYRLNAGGPEVAALDEGPNWLADSDFLLVPGSGKTFSTAELAAGLALPSGAPGEIFATERFSEASDVDTPMQYAFDVESGTYEVRLYMGNGFEGTSLAGQRVFDVAIEGQVLSTLDNIDLSGDFGHLVGGAISNEVVVTDGELNIEFLHDMVEGIQNPLVNGIEIVQLSNDSTLPPAVSLIQESVLVDEESGFSQTTFLASEPVPSGSSVEVSFEIVPGTATPLQDYVYQSATAAFDAQTGVYTDTVTIPSGASLASVTPAILQDAVEEGSETFSVNILDVEGANFEVDSAPSATTVIVDGSQPSPLRVELEDTTFSTFQLSDLKSASGGQVINFGGNEVGEIGISTISLDALDGFYPGEYEVALATFDILFAGGLAATTFSVELNEETTIGEVVLRESFEETLINPGVAVERVIAEKVQLGAGDTLTVKGFKNPDEAFWLDYIQLNPVEMSAIAQL